MDEKPRTYSRSSVCNKKIAIDNMTCVKTIAPAGIKYLEKSKKKRRRLKETYKRKYTRYK